MDAAGAEETLTSVASILEKMVQSGVPHLVPARCNGKNENRKTSIARSPLNRLSTKIATKNTKALVSSTWQCCGVYPSRVSPNFAAMWGGHPSEQRGRARVSLKSWATLLFSECLVPFPGFPTWCEERSPRQKVVDSTILLSSVCLQLSKNSQAEMCLMKNTL